MTLSPHILRRPPALSQPPDASPPYSLYSTPLGSPSSLPALGSHRPGSSPTPWRVQPVLHQSEWTPPRQNETDLQDDIARMVSPLLSQSEDLFVDSLFQALENSSWQGILAWSDSGSSFLVIDVEAFKYHVLAELFEDLPFAEFVQRLILKGFRTTVKTCRLRHSSATLEAWEFAHSHFRRTSASQSPPPGSLSPISSDHGVELSQPAALLLAKAQDEISYYRRENERLCKQNSSSIGGSPESRSLLFGPENDNRAVFPPVGSPRAQYPQSVHSSPHLHTPPSLDPSQTGSPHHHGLGVYVHPPTPGPAEDFNIPAMHSPRAGMEFTHSPPQGPSVLKHDSDSHRTHSFGSPSFVNSSLSLPGTVRDKSLDNLNRGTSSEPSMSRGPSRMLSPLMSPRSQEHEDSGDEHDMRLVGLGDNLASLRGVNMASPDLIERSEVRAVIRDIMNAIVESLPTHLINTEDGQLYERSVLGSHFEASAECSHLLDLMTTKSLTHKAFIKEVIRTYFQYAMLSHTWEGMNEPLFTDISQGIYVPDLPVQFSKLRNFCMVAKTRALRWAWCDTCCINRDSSAELEEAITSMFRWYRKSALTIVYLSDVSGFAAGELAQSRWFRRGWTLQELLAPGVMQFYDRTWTSCVPGAYNHKLVPEWMEALGRATSIPADVLQDFLPGTENARAKLRWAAMRQTTRVEDLGYCLFGIFDVALQPQYGEGEKAFGRLLVELARTTQDTSLLDWVGKRSERCSAFPVSPIGFLDAAFATANNRNSVSPPSSSSPSPSPSLGQQIQAAGNVVAEIEESIWSRLSPSSKLKLASPLLSVGDGVVEVLCFLHTVQQAKRIASSGMHRTDGSEKEVQYLISAEGLKDFRVVVNIKDALEDVPSSRTPFVVARVWDSALTEQTTDKGGVVKTSKHKARDLIMKPFLAMLLMKSPDGARYSQRISTEMRIVAQLTKLPRDYQPVVVRLS